ncbi:hypothetical protein G7046_g3105 [Stylonectria norvegica]|nr:hypothetical protein G7046_g3105 [Stylonectria norvegica]
MVRLMSSAAVVALLFSIISATPVKNIEKRAAIPRNLLGYDKKKNRVLKPNENVPEIRILNNDDFAGNETFTELPPFVVSDADIAKRFINGGDERFQFTSKSYPYPAVGKLQWSNGVFCSGSLIGPRHVLTAKHCLVNGASGTFSPGFDNGAPFGTGQVVTAITSGYEWGTPCGYKGDWAIMILNQRLGDNVGYFGVKLPQHDRNDQPIFDHVGYPGDRDNGNRPYREYGNPVWSARSNWDCDSTGPYYTDTDCMGGQSGGPHWEATSSGPYIWGTLSVTFDGGNGLAWAGWGSGNQLVDAVGRTRSEYP